MPVAIKEELIRHKWHANAAYLAAVCSNEAARQDEELRKLFHHILVSNRFWLFLTLGREFEREKETQMPDALDFLIERYKKTWDLEMEWLPRSNDSELNRQVATPRLPGQTFTVAEVFMQTCLHSHAHRAQSAGRLRSFGITPPGNRLRFMGQGQAGSRVAIAAKCDGLTDRSETALSPDDCASAGARSSAGDPASQV